MPRSRLLEAAVPIRPEPMGVCLLLPMLLPAGDPAAAERAGDIIWSAAATDALLLTLPAGVAPPDARLLPPPPPCDWADRDDMACCPGASKNFSRKRGAGELAAWVCFGVVADMLISSKPILFAACTSHTLAAAVGPSLSIQARLTDSVIEPIHKTFVRRPQERRDRNGKKHSTCQCCGFCSNRSRHSSWSSGTSQGAPGPSPTWLAYAGRNRRSHGWPYQLRSLDVLGGVWSTELEARVGFQAQLFTTYSWDLMVDHLDFVIVSLLSRYVSRYVCSLVRT